MTYLFEDYSLDTERRELRRGTYLISVEPQVLISCYSLSAIAPAWSAGTT